MDTGNFMPKLRSCLLLLCICVLVSAWNKRNSYMFGIKKHYNKLWHSYTRKMLSKFLTENFHVYLLKFFEKPKEFKHNTFNSIHMAGQFSTTLNCASYLSQSTKYSLVLELHSRAVVKNVKTANIFNPSGGIDAQYPQNDTFICVNVEYVREKPPRTIQFEWVFNLHPLLSLNLTVHHLYISSGPALCYFGRLMVYLTKTSGFKFCGQHTKFSTYTVLQRVPVRLEIYACTIGTMNSTFVVINKNLVITTKEKHFPTENQEPYSSVLVWRKIQRHSFFVKTHKIHSLIISTHSKFVWLFSVFDGPDTESSSFAQRKVALSGFQCVVEVYTNSSDAQHFNFTSKKIKISQHFVFQTTFPAGLNISVPSQNCSENICVLRLNVLPPFKINATVTGIMYLGKESQTCLYSGLLSVEETPDNIVESSIVCKRDNRDLTTGRNFYSHNSSLVLLVFRYKHLADISANVTVSLSECNFVNVCPCQFEAFCRAARLFCRLYWKQHSTSGVKLASSNKITSSQRLLLPTDFEKCVIIQFTQSDKFAELYYPFVKYVPRRYHPARCSVSVASDEFRKHGFLITLDIRGQMGSLPVYPFLKFTFNDTSSSGCTFSTIVGFPELCHLAFTEITGLFANDFVFNDIQVGSREFYRSQISDAHPLGIEAYPTVMRMFQRSNYQTLSYKDFYAYAVLKPSVGTDLLIKWGNTVNSNSWMEIIVKMENASTHHSDSPTELVNSRSSCQSGLKHLQQYSLECFPLAQPFVSQLSFHLACASAALSENSINLIVLAWCFS